MEKERVTKQELDNITAKWLDEQDPDNFDNPVTRVAPSDDGSTYDPQKDAAQWAQQLPDA